MADKDLISKKLLKRLLVDFGTQLEILPNLRPYAKRAIFVPS